MTITPLNFSCFILGLILARGAMQWILERLNRQEALRHADHVPESFRDLFDPPAYARSIEYTLAKSRLESVTLLWNVVILIAVLYSGVLPSFGQFVQQHWGGAAWAQTAFLLGVGVLLTIPDLPLDWFHQFRLEERFGFNTTTPRLWWIDRFKGLLLSLAIGFPVVLLVLKTVEWAGDRWWLWAWLCLLSVQGLMMLLAPVLILPLFNRFTPLPDGPLRVRLLDLAERLRFPARQLEVMDGSKRSRHSNAFFTGFGRFRKIVLFDTLIQQLTEPELEGVLAHEIGHYKRKHTLKMFLASAAGLLAALGCIAWLARQTWFYQAFGFAPGKLAPALLLFGLLAGTVTFWLSPLTHFWSRRFEYEADAFAARAVNDPAPLIGALRKLTEKNLGNLTPHPFYSRFYYSHPTLLERERALR